MIEAALLDEKECKNAERCFETHMVHATASVNGRIEMIEADVDSLIDAIIPAARAYFSSEALWSAADHFKSKSDKFGGSLSLDWVAQELRMLAVGKVASKT